MEQSILGNIKKMLGLDSDYTAFDTDVITLINSALMTLHQYGIGPKNGFIVRDASQTWSDLLMENGGKMLEAVKTYIYLKVKIVFDPPSTSFVLDAFQNTCNEIEWRLKEQLESYRGDLPREDDSGGDS